MHGTCGNKVFRADCRDDDLRIVLEEGLKSQLDRIPQLRNRQEETRGLSMINFYD